MGTTPLHGNPDRPKLPEKVEQKFERTDKLSAVAYTLLEHNTALLEELLDGTVQADMEVTDSLIHDVRHVVQPKPQPAESELHDEGRAPVGDPSEGGSGGR